MPKKFKGKSTAGAKAKEQKRLSSLEKKRAQDDKKNRELEVQWNVRQNHTPWRDSGIETQHKSEPTYAVRQREIEEKRLAKQQKQDLKMRMLAEENLELKMKAQRKTGSSIEKQTQSARFWRLECK